MFRAPRLFSAVTGAVAAAVLIGSTATLAASSGPPLPRIPGEASRAAIPGRYIVKLKDTATLRTQSVARLADALSTRYHGTVGETWEALRGFTVAMSETDARMLAAEPGIEYVTRDHYRLAPRQKPAATAAEPGVTPFAAQTPVAWNLDRIDQHALPLDNSYAYDDSAGTGVRVYVISSGITASHPDFGGRAAYGPNFSGDSGASTDCLGTGTEIAGVIAGTQYGVAKQAGVVGIRIYTGSVSQCSGVIHAPFSGILSAFNWVISNAPRPAAIVYNVGDGCVDPMTGQPVACDPMDLQRERDAQSAAVASGLSVVAAAGESNANRCALDGGVAPGTFYVGATTAADAKAGFSNWGPCLNMWAPGDTVSTTSLSGAIATSGTHVAAAHVAGTVALFLGKPEFAGAPPNTIYQELVTNRSTPNVLTGIGTGSPNLLLFTGPPGFYTIGDSAALVPAGGGLKLFGVNKPGSMFQRGQFLAGGPWSSWAQSFTKGWLSVAAEPHADGRLALAGLTPSGELWLREETAAGSGAWYNWAKLSGAPNSVPIGRVVMAYHNSNRLQMFATTHQGQAYHRMQLSPGGKTWGSWTAFSFAGKLRAITAARNSDGRTEVLAIDDAGQVWRTAQTTATDTTWAPFTKLGGIGVTQIAVSRNANGRLELIGVDAGGNAWRRTQTGATTWTAWGALPPKALARVTAETNAAGRVQLIAVDNLGNIWQSQQTAANATTYSAWSQLDGQLRP